MPSHEERAREIVERNPSVRAAQLTYERANRLLQEAIASALRTGEMEAYERAASLCEQYRHDAHTFGAVPTDPMLAMSVAAREISSAIRALSTDSQDT